MQYTQNIGSLVSNNFIISRLQLISFISVTVDISSQIKHSSLFFVR